MNALFKVYLKSKGVVVPVNNLARSYARWSHRRPLKVISSEHYEEDQNESSLHSARRAAAEKNQKYLEDMSRNLLAEEGGRSRGRRQRVGASDAAKQQDDLDPSEKNVKNKWRYDTDEDLIVERNDVDKKRQKQSDKPKKSPKIGADMFETVLEADGNFVYTKMANNDARVGSILTSLKSKKEKAKMNLILLEGKRLIEDALIGGCTLKYLIFSRKDEVESLKDRLPKLGAKLYKMPYREMQMWSDLTTCPGIFGVFKVPEVDKYEPKSPLPLTIVCDNVRDPGNMGAILRAAAGVGCKKVLLTKGCVNIWETKVVRSAAGSLFRLQIHDKIDFKDVPQHIEGTVKWFVADSSFENGPSKIDADIPVIPYYSAAIKKDDQIVLVVGGESHGLTADCYEFTRNFNGVRLNIPLDNGVESLNTGMALGIICFEMKRQLLKLRQDLAVDLPIETDVSLSLRGL